MKDLYVWAENIRSIYNVGSFFRSCDAVGASKLLLSGVTAHPPHPRLSKTALGSSKTVPWEYYETSFDVLEMLEDNKITLVSLEITKSSTDIFLTKFNGPTCLVLGNEVEGVSQETLDRSSYITHIPMEGQKSSLNVASAAAIGIYEVRRKLLGLVG